MLQGILEQTREDVSRRKRERPLPGDGASASTAHEPGAFARALAREELGVIAEFKRRSPSAGTLRDGAELAPMLQAYERGGAVAVSVLTEETSFGGSLADLKAARELTALPLLRKDFIVDPYQLQEAALAGADAVLLIVAALADGELVELHSRARTLGLDVLVEVHDAAELARALAVGAEIIGINNRDLRDFSVDLGRSETLAGEVPAGIPVVSESGIAGPAQLARLAARGVAAVLVGETLMRAEDPEAALRALKTFRPADEAL